MQNALELAPLTIVLILLIGFASGFLDSIVGGGGLIGTPAMLNLFPDWHILRVIGTNRTSSISGTSVAAWNYLRHVVIERRILFPACIGACVSSFAGVQLAQCVPGDLLKKVVLCVIIALAIYSLFKKKLGQEEHRRFPPEKERWAALAVGSACGFYNGLIGPGTGTLLVFGFVAVLGLDFLKSSAVSKAANVSGDLSSWLSLLAGGFVVWKVALPLVVSNMAGSFLGSRLAILRGVAWIRWVFLAVVFGLVGRLAWQVFF